MVFTLFSGLNRVHQNFTQNQCSSPIGSMDSIIVVENESGDRQDFTTIQVGTTYLPTFFKKYIRQII